MTFIVIYSEHFVSWEPEGCHHYSKMFWINNNERHAIILDFIQKFDWQNFLHFGDFQS